MSTAIEHAVIKTGGKQYRVSQGDVIFVEKLDKAEGETIVFTDVLAVFGKDKIKTGNPVKGVEVSGTVLKNGKNKKIKVFKYKAKKNYRVLSGHRQPYTKIQISSIAVVGP
ncbi:MAG: 50S ribosomal protein L21 [Oscillospiraceae bacterium]|nr:50S ribosomal protein L21 [Oscillospiraceae bacterium]